MLALGPLNLHNLLTGFDDNSAQAVCTFGYCAGPGEEPLLFQGRTDGKLVASRGPTVFGESPRPYFSTLQLVISALLMLDREIALIETYMNRLGLVFRVLGRRIAKGEDVCGDGQE
jgi:hypothetical protein